jgi:hypothetical protein
MLEIQPRAKKIQPKKAPKILDFSEKRKKNTTLLSNFIDYLLSFKV